MPNQYTAPAWPERFWDKTVVLPSGCIEWTGRLDRDGYGQGYDPKTGRWSAAHRTAYRLATGVDPEMPLDHVCRNRKCVNATHLREATPYENAQNGAWKLATACKHGHPWDQKNTYVHNGTRICRACNRRIVAARKLREGR